VTTPAQKLAAVDLYSLKKGDTDYLGNIIEQVYAKEPGKYLIYVTTDHQLICKAEDESIARQANINKLLLQIGDFISHNRSLKPTYNSSLAYAMKIFFDGDAISSYHSLQNVYSNIKRHLTRRAKLAYQAGAASILFLSLAAFLIAVRLGGSNQLTVDMFVVTLFSSAGGFLSVAIGAARLSIDLQHSFWINMLYGALRIIISIISGVIVYFLIQTGILLAFLKDASEVNGLIIVSVVAGFSEKLVPNLMSKIGDRYERQSSELGEV
jgi:hypothetical protein